MCHNHGTHRAMDLATDKTIYNIYAAIATYVVAMLRNLDAC